MVTGASGRIYQISSGRGGVPKMSTPKAIINGLGIDGDFHNDLVNHGGPDRALCIYTLEQIQRLQREGHPIWPGSTGENITLEGVRLEDLTPGTHLQLGDEVELEVTSYAHPCQTIADSFNDGNFTRISEKLCPGQSRVYARVVRKGTIATGQPVLVYHQDTEE